MVKEIEGLFETFLTVPSILILGNKIHEIHAKTSTGMRFCCIHSM